MQNNNTIHPIEKIISVLSYISMGLIGFIWLIIAYFLKMKTRPFLMYNITQSIIISLIFALFKLLINIILSIIALVPFLDFVVALLNLIISLKVISVSFMHLSFSIFEFLVFILLCYIIAGVCMGKIFYIPKLTKLMQKILKS